MGKTHKLGAFRDGGVHHALVLVVIGGDNFTEGRKPAAFCYWDAAKVHGVVQGCLEALRLEVKRIHHLLGVPHGKFRRRCLEDVPRVFRGETENLLTVHHGLAKSIGNLGNSFLCAFMADRIEIHAPPYA